MQQPTRLERRIDAAAHRFLADAPRAGRAGDARRGRRVPAQAGVGVPVRGLAARRDRRGAALVPRRRGARAQRLPDARGDRHPDHHDRDAARDRPGAVGDRAVPHHRHRRWSCSRPTSARGSYAAEGVLRIGGVPLFSGFMYAAVGSYMVRVYRLFDLGFTRYPRRWLTAIVAVGDLRQLLHAPLDLGPAVGAAGRGRCVLWARTVMYARVWRRVLRMPLLAAFAGVAVFIYLAENIAHLGGRLGVSRSAGRLAAGLDHEARVVVPADDHLGRAGDVGVPAEAAGRGRRRARDRCGPGRSARSGDSARTGRSGSETS